MKTTVTELQGWLSGMLPDFEVEFRMGHRKFNLFECWEDDNARVAVIELEPEP